MSSARNTAIVPWILSFIHAMYQAVLLRLGLSTHPQGIQEALEEFTCASKLFKMNGKEYLLCVYPDEKLVALCFLVVSSENAYMSKRNSNELEQDKLLIVKSPQLTPVQRWLLFFDNMSNAVQNSEFSCSLTQLVIDCLGVQFKYPLVPEKHVTNYATLLFKMQKISNSMAEKITELQEKIFEQDEQLLELQVEDEGTDGTYETDIPIQRVLHLLSSWRNGPLRRDSVNVDFVTRILKNNSLYSIAAQEEEDTEVKGWLANEVGCGSATTPTTHKTSTQNWGRVRAYSRVLNFTNALQYQIAKHQDIEYPEEIRLALQDVDSFDWDVFEMNKASFNRPLYFTALYLFEKHDLFHKCRISVQHFKNFMETMECGYKNNPYHNAIHATDVLQTVHALLTRSSKTGHLNDIEKFALLISAIVHDYEHPGVNNIFEKATETDRAILYNDQSILENHHCSQAFRVMNKPNCNILESLDKEQRKYFRETVISLVLATDITKHGEIIGKLKATVVGEFEPENMEHTANVLKMFVKCADVGNPAKNPNMSRLWAERVMQEFYEQGDREKELALPVSNMMDREKPNMPKAQDGFITYIVRPLFECLAQFDQEFKPLLDNVNSNRDYWKEEILRTDGHK